MRRLALMLAVVALTGCAHSEQATPPLTYPLQLVPADTPGYEFTKQASLEKKFAVKANGSIITGGRLYTIRSGASVEGSFQTTLFAKGVSNQDPGVQKGILNGLGGGGRGFTTVHLGLAKLLTAPNEDEIYYVWFPPQHNVMELFVLRAGFTGGGQLVRSLVGAQLGITVPPPSPGGSS